MEVFAVSRNASRGPAMVAVDWREKWPPVSTIVGKTMVKMREESPMALSLPGEASGHARDGDRALEQRDCGWGVRA